MSTVDTYREGTPCWVDLSSTDAEAAKAFYSGLLGWSFTDMPMGDGMTYSMASLKDRWVAGLSQQFPDQAAAGMPSYWASYLAVDDADAAAARAVEAGAALLVPPSDVPNDSGRFFVTTDPGGAAIGFWQAKNHQGTGIVNEPGTVVWHELTVADVSAVLPFYQSVAGVGVETAPMGEIGDYTTFMVDGRPVAGALNAQPGMPNAWTVYFAVPDIEEALVKIPELGGSVLAPAFDIPFGRMAVVADSTGAVFAAMQLTEAEYDPEPTDR
ncbi:VOC family protein [Psychromicrobium xiongbiense]|uniref:VOC family protein n=1 Tax=Psychromicrobium xiongbiense TaxID=3051184 RepID=UPI002553DFB1|nr:VOC family protein [Psychromicrobium sp. YIM S02556]